MQGIRTLKHKEYKLNTIKILILSFADSIVTGVDFFSNNLHGYVSRLEALSRTT